MQSGIFSPLVANDYLYINVNTRRPRAFNESNSPGRPYKWAQARHLVLEATHDFPDRFLIQSVGCMTFPARDSGDTSNIKAPAVRINELLFVSPEPIPQLRDSGITFSKLVKALRERCSVWTQVQGRRSELPGDTRGTGETDDARTFKDEQQGTAKSSWLRSSDGLGGSAARMEGEFLENFVDNDEVSAGRGGRCRSDGRAGRKRASEDGAGGGRRGGRGHAISGEEEGRVSEMWRHSHSLNRPTQQKMYEQSKEDFLRSLIAIFAGGEHRFFQLTVKKGEWQALVMRAPGLSCHCDALQAEIELPSGYPKKAPSFTLKMLQEGARKNVRRLKAFYPLPAPPHPRGFRSPPSRSLVWTQTPSRWSTLLGAGDVTR
eukprot:755490-Hanusia_phi.AAC.2